VRQCLHVYTRVNSSARVQTGSSLPHVRHVIAHLHESAIHSFLVHFGDQRPTSHPASGIILAVLTVLAYPPLDRREATIEQRRELVHRWALAIIAVIAVDAVATVMFLAQRPPGKFHIAVCVRERMFIIYVCEGVRGVDTHTCLK